jgi:hypothetical protein
MATFITSKAVGETITIYVQASTPMTQGSNYWKYNHNGVDSAVFPNGEQTITVANANGEFTLIPCLSDGTPSGNINILNLNSNQLTSFDGNGLSSLTTLVLQSNLLTSFNGAGLSSLTDLNLYDNQLTSFDGNGLTSLNGLNLYNNQLTSFDGTGLTSLTILYLQNNQITSFDGTDLTSLQQLSLTNNLLTSLDVSPMTLLNNLHLADPYGLQGNPMTATANNNVLTALVANGVTGGNFSTANGRTSAGTADYNTLIADGWNLVGLDLITPPPSGNGKLRIKGVNSGGGTTTTTTTTVPTYYVYDFTSFGVEAKGEFSNQFNKAGVTNWDGTYRIVATDLNTGTLVYYIGTDGDKHLFTFNNVIIQDASNGIIINETGINGITILGTVTFDSITPFGVTTTTTTTEAPTTTTTTAPPLWDGGTIYSIGAVVTHEGQTWNCIQYAPAGYGPFGGYINVYWTL